jgi:hypothetical protein
LKLLILLLLLTLLLLLLTLLLLLHLQLTKSFPYGEQSLKSFRVSGMTFFIILISIKLCSFPPHLTD